MNALPATVASNLYPVYIITQRFMSQAIQRNLLSKLYRDSDYIAAIIFANFLVFWGHNEIKKMHKVSSENDDDIHCSSS